MESMSDKYKEYFRIRNENGMEEYREFLEEEIMDMEKRIDKVINKE